MVGKNVGWVDFEDEVFRHVDSLLKAGYLMVNPSRAKTIRRGSYYSEPRKSKIEFEIAIEEFDEGASVPSLVWVWECKDHSNSGRSVEVGEIESLNDKIDQLGRSRFKGSLVTTHGFQEGAKQRAIACGISLFVLEKELRRMTQYSRDSPDFMEIEAVVLSDGVSFGGKTIAAGDLFETALILCLHEVGVTSW